MQRNPRFWRPATAVAIALVASLAIAACPERSSAASTIGLKLAAAVSGPTVRTPAGERGTVSAGGPAAVAPTSTTQGFLGLATSFSTIPVLSGSATDPDIPFRTLLKNLSPGAPFQLRLGGVSADDSWWPIPGMKLPLYLRTLTPRMAADVRVLLTALGGQAILGVNLELKPKIDPAIAKAEVADFNRYIGPSLIDAFELGNEPEYWPLSVVNGGPGRDTIPAYGKKFSQIASELGGVPLAGPASVGTVWLGELGTVLDHLPSHLKVVTVHAYPLKNCSLGARPLLSQLVARSSIQGMADSVHAMVKAAAAHGAPLRVDELNGITCGGKAGLSNSFGEALWALNVLPALWRAGVQGVNYQTVDGLLNQVITAHRSASGWRVSVEPVYYGLLAFAQAAPAGSHLLRISNPGLAHLYQFAVRAPDGSERVVLTNVGSAARTIGVTASGTHGTGSLSLLSAKSLSATGGTTLAGQTLSPRTGQLGGKPRLTLVKPNARGVYAVRVPAHAAAILTLSS
jgi:hypothetical protein